MDNALENPFDSLLDSDDAPAWAWKAGGTIVGLAGAAAVRWLLEQVRQMLSSRGRAPLNPADERMSWPNAMLWAAFIAVGAAFGRLLTQRALAAAWTKRKGRPVRAMPTTRA